MRRPFVYGAGGVLSADIAVPEYQNELDFYSAILTTGEAPLWREDLTNNLGTPVIGLGARTPGYDELPLQWMPHFQVADVGASATCAVEMGGEELMHSKAEDGQSQWAVLSDRDGAAFGVIPVVAGESGSTAQDERFGRISWLSLIVPDALQSRGFYKGVVGWSARADGTENGEGPPVRFEMLIDNEIAAAEICQFTSGFKGIPPVWLVHLPVDDLVESLRRVGRGGGQVIKEYAEAKTAIIRDPVGVYVALQADGIELSR